ncbi:MAG TPA: type II toxin-antitoxin system Phd/YefM family antitoxin [Mycobacteriales bacterium]
MTIAEQMPLAEVKNRLSEVVDEVEREHARVVITKHGRPAAIVMSIDDLESLEETLEIMSNPQLVADIREARAAIEAGDVTAFTKEEALRLIARSE